MPQNWEGDEPPKIGAKLKHARHRLGLRLCEVSERAGVTEGYLSKLENNRSHASIPTLHRLVEVLGINMGELFVTSFEDELPISVIRSSARPKLMTGDLDTENQITLERLVPAAPGQLLQVNLHSIAPNSGNAEPIKHDGEEFGFVISGSIELTVEKHVVKLHEGDSFHFDSSLSHSYRNIERNEARILWVNTPPTF